MNEKFRNLVLLWTISVMALLGLTFYNSVDFNSNKAIPVDINRVQGINYSKNPEVFRLAVSSVISPVETIKGYTPLIKYLEEKLSRKIELVQRRTYEEVNYLVQRGEIDLAFICTLSYVEAERNFGAQLVTIPQVNGSNFYRSIVITRKDSPIKSLEDLKGKKFAFTDPMSFSGRAAMIGELANIGKKAETFFGSIIYTYSHDNSLRAVHEGLVDAASIDSIVFDLTAKIHPEITNNIEIIHASRFVGNPPVILSQYTSDEEFALIRKILLNMHNDEDGREALDALMFDKFVMPDNSSYDYIRELIDSLEINYRVE